MITSTRIGRYGNLCNSMFQYAAVVAMAKKTGLEYCIPQNETYYEPNYGCNNTSIWDGFKIKSSVLPTIETSAPNHEHLVPKFNEVEFPFEYKDIQVDDFTDMKGFFQSEKYFENANDEVRRSFGFKDDLLKDLRKKFKSGHYPSPRECTSLHIRLGDYTHKRAYHPAQPASYWKQAVDEAALDYIVVFSDDIEQAKRMFKGDKRVIYSEEQCPFAALYHMSRCRNHIICNSTFGWWGAKLGEWHNEDDNWAPVDKTIVAPKIWFGPAHDFSSEDIIPNRWIKL